nr:hypothetical protein [Rhizobium ruizarguesonis]
MFELGKAGDNAEDETPFRIGKVGMGAPSAEHANVDAPLGFDGRNQMNEPSAETIQTPDDELVAGTAFVKSGIQSFPSCIASSGRVGIDGVTVRAAERIELYSEVLTFG